MKQHVKHGLVALALAATAVGAQAQVQPAPVRPYLGFFLTGGGDTLASALVENGFGDVSTRSVKAGGLVDLKAGVEFLLNPAFSVRGTVGYHVDSVNADNGDITFSRVPFEVMAVFHPGEPLHLGVGMRIATGASLSGSGVASAPTIDFDADPGLVLEGEYQFSPMVGVAVRFVSERYKAKRPYTGTADGNHVGIGLNLHF